MGAKVFKNSQKLYDSCFFPRIFFLSRSLMLLIGEVIGGKYTRCRMFNIRTFITIWKAEEAFGNAFVSLKDQHSKMWIPRYMWTLWNERSPDATSSRGYAGRWDDGRCTLHSGRRHPVTTSPPFRSRKDRSQTLHCTPCCGPPVDDQT